MSSRKKPRKLFSELSYSGRRKRLKMIASLEDEQFEKVEGFSSGEGSYNNRSDINSKRFSKCNEDSSENENWAEISRVTHIEVNNASSLNSVNDQGDDPYEQISETGCADSAQAFIGHSTTSSYSEDSDSVKLQGQLNGIDNNVQAPMFSGSNSSYGCSMGKKNESLNLSTESCSNSTLNLRKTLKEWMNEEKKVHHDAVSRLLKKLQKDFPELPVSAKSLVSNDTDYVFREMHLGEYVHFNWILGLEKFLAQNTEAESLIDINLCVNVDGLCLFQNNSKYSAYPILVKILGAQQKILCAGIYCSNKVAGNHQTVMPDPR